MTMPRASRPPYGDSGLQAKRVVRKQAESRVEYAIFCGFTVLDPPRLVSGPTAVLISHIDHVGARLPRKRGAEVDAKSAEVALVIGAIAGDVTIQW